MTPLKAFGPKNAELAPEIISTFMRSSSDAPRKLPSAKLRPGEALSTPSIICNERTGDVLLNPLVLITLNPRLAEVKSTPFK